MTLKFRARQVDNTTERLICTGLIVSDMVLAQVAPILHADIMTTKYTSTIARWCLDYYRQFGKAPGLHIQDMFESAKRDYLEEETADLIESLLAGLSQDNAGHEMNDLYVVEQAEQYIKSRQAQILCEDVLALISKGQILEAEGKLAGYSIPKLASTEGNEVFVSDFWDEQEEQTECLFTLPGALHDLVGPIERDSFISLLAPEKRGKCIAEGQRVLLADGTLKPIEQVIRDRDSHIMCFDEKARRFVPGRIMDWWDNGHKDVLEVVFRSGRKVRVTGNHPFLSPSGWKNVSDIGVGGYAAAPRYIEIGGHHNMPEHEIRLLAYLIAEGCLTRGTVLFTNADECIQQDFTRCVELMGDRASPRGSRGMDFEVVNCLENKGKHYRNFTRAMLEKHGLLGCSSKDKQIPVAILQLAAPDVALFLRVLFSCDGWVTRHQVGISFTNEQLSRTTQHLLTRFGITSVLRYKPSNGAWQVTIQSAEDKTLFVEKIGFLENKQGKALSFVLGWKSRKSKSFINKFPPEIARQCQDSIRQYMRENGIPIYRGVDVEAWKSISYQVNKQAPIMRQSFERLKSLPPVRALLEDPILWDEIISINAIGQMHTYDLTVAKHHNFIAEGCLVHNTWWLLYFALTAFRQRRNVAFFSCGDMTKPQMRKRLRHMLTGRDPKRARAIIHMPTLDCYYNQIGECPLGEETDSIVLRGKGEKTKRCGTYEDFPDHVPCTKCYKSKQDRENFFGSPWMQEVKLQDIEKPLDEACAAILKRSGHKHFKLFCYPPATLTVSQISAQLDILQQQEGFVPDVIVIDYADLLDVEPSARRLEYRHQINASWMAMRALSQTRRCALITATQSKLETRKKSQVDQWDTSEDKRKLAHVTAMLALNQTPAEKRQGLMRISNIAMRDDDFDTEKNVAVLQCLAAGKPYIISYPYRMRQTENQRNRSGSDE